jgi:protein CLEC16A
VHVQAQVIQTLTILLFNVKRDIVLTYLLSNNHINDIINHDFDFEHEEVGGPPSREHSPKLAHGCHRGPITAYSCSDTRGYEYMYGWQIRDPYINLLRTIAMRITKHTAALFFNQRQRTGLAYCPLFKRAITFLSHPERLARTAARTVALSLYRGECLAACGPSRGDSDHVPTSVLVPSNGLIRPP